jgi:hypothetical protein
MIDKMAEAGELGYSVRELGVVLGVSHRTLYNYANPNHSSYNQAFALAFDEFKETAHAFWLAASRESIFSDSGLNSKAIELNLRNRLGMGITAKHELQDGTEVDNASNNAPMLGEGSRPIIQINLGDLLTRIQQTKEPVERGITYEGKEQPDSRRYEEGKE